MHLHNNNPLQYPNADEWSAAAQWQCTSSTRSSTTTQEAAPCWASCCCARHSLQQASLSSFLGTVLYICTTVHSALASLTRPLVMLFGGVACLVDGFVSNWNDTFMYLDGKNQKRITKIWPLRPFQYNTSSCLVEEARRGRCSQFSSATSNPNPDSAISDCTDRPPGNTVETSA